MTRDDLVIIGGGPVGIWGLYNAGLRQLKTRLVESLEELGGQLTAMYPEKDIFDVPGFPRVLARDLVQRLTTQGVGDGIEISLNEQVLDIHPDGDGWRLVTTVDERYAKGVIISTGLGAFRPKALGLPEEAGFVGRGLSYFLKRLEPLYGKRVVVVGGGDSALDWVNALRDKSDVTLVHRRDRFAAHEEAVKEAVTSGRVTVRTPYEVAAIRGRAGVEEVVLRHVLSHDQVALEADHLLVCIGFHADIGPMKNWGLDLDANRIRVTTEMATNRRGIFAAGDVVTYPGRLNLIAIGFGEMAIAVHSAASHIRPDAPRAITHSSTRGF